MRMTQIRFLICVNGLETLDAAESALRRLHDPLQDASSVVTVSEDVVARRKTMLRALGLHLVELLNVKLVIADDAPIVGGGIHRETRRKGAVSADNE